MNGFEQDVYVHPGQRHSQSGNPVGHGQGITLRDWFAGQAVSGIAGISGDGFSLSPQDAAQWAYQIADAMLASRSE